MDRYFRDLPLTELSGATVVLDVDGTLLPDRDIRLHASVREHLALLASSARVYLASNARGGARLDALASGMPVRVIRSRHRKPDTRVLRDLEQAGPLIVVGDKYLTDGLLAAFLKARFIKVRPLMSGGERLSVRLAYLLDPLLGSAVCFFVRLLP